MAIFLPQVLCLLLFQAPFLKISPLEIEEPSSNSSSNISKASSAPTLSQWAPYSAIFDRNTSDGVQEEQNKGPSVSVRLTEGAGAQLRQQLGVLAQQHQQQPGDRDDTERAWMLIGPNGTIVGHKLNVNIEKLLHSLNSNNFTSEICVDGADPTRIVNITISAGAPLSSLAQQNSDRLSTQPLDEMLLEELILDAMPVYRDNHRFETGKNRTLRPRPPAPQAALSDPVITPPPIRAAMEVVAENYTVQKVAEEANVFGLKLLHQVNAEKLGSSNLVQAPFAVYQGLGLLMTGAMGDTARELDKVLLGVQSTYENQKLTHDQDRDRLLASFSDVVRQLYTSATNHLRDPQAQAQASSSSSSGSSETTIHHSGYSGGTPEQHLIITNNLLFSSSAYEISQEFKQYLANYYNQTTALTRIEVGSTESIQTINGWIRRATNGLVATIIDKRNTFDETNVMSLLSTSWLQQEWRDNFHRVELPTRSNIRLKGQGRAAFGLISDSSSSNNNNNIYDRANLLEFVDDNKQSHFVEYIKSEPSKNIHVYKSMLASGQPVELITVPFRDSNHRLITITPLQSNQLNLSLLLQQQQQHQQSAPLATDDGASPVETLPDSSSLSKLIALMSNNPRKVMRSIWNIIAPDIITKQTLKSIQQARQKNITIDEQLVGANVIPLVQLSIPILRTNSDTSLSAALNHIGVVNTFDPYQANLIGINGHPFNYYKLHLSNVLFKTTFNLNERGINYDQTIRTLESMRIKQSNQRQTQQQLNKSSADDEGGEHGTFKMEFIDDVKLNRPFVYMICDMRTKLILYTGSVRNPAQSQ